MHPALTRGCSKELCPTVVADRLAVAGLNSFKWPLHNPVVPMASAPPFPEELYPELIPKLNDEICDSSQTLELSPEPRFVLLLPALRDCSFLVASGLGAFS